MQAFQNNPVIGSRIKTFKEIYLDFIACESNVFQMDQGQGLLKMYGTIPDPDFPAVVGRKLATLCISLNEHPAVRFQASSAYAREMAMSMNEVITSFKKKNSHWWCYGEDSHMERERGQMLILDRTFDPLTPLMHEYTYSAMVNDLLSVEDNVIAYSTTTNKGTKELKEALLGESDALWTELRYYHIAKVIAIIKERMSDIIQTNAGALSKQGGGSLSITEMAAAVKELPEYRQTMSKLSQHVSIAQQCMDAFGKLGLMQMSQLEQTMSTGVDEDGKEVKGAKLIELLKTALTASGLKEEQKIRLLSIFVVSQRGATPEEKRQLVQASRLSGDDQQIILNLERLCLPVQTAQSATGKAAGNIFTSLFKGRAPTHAATAEGEYADTRHVGQLKGLLEQLINGDLPIAKYSSLGPSLNSGDGKSMAKSVRRNVGANAKFGRREQGSYNGGRFISFIAGGVAYSELRVAHDLMTEKNKEILIGGTHLINPTQFIYDVSDLNKSVTSASATPHGSSDNV